MKATYNTVKTAKLVDEHEDTAARRAIDACPFLTPATERDIDLALGIGTMKLDNDVEPVMVFDEDEIQDIMEAAGPSDEALDKIVAEERENA